MPSHSRRSVLAGISAGPLLVGAGCVSSRTETDTRTPTSAPTMETTIELVMPSVTGIEEKPVRPLRFEDLPAGEREILRTAREEGEYSVEYGKHEGLPDDEEPVRSLVDRILARFDSQEETYLQNHDDESVPDYVDAVYLDYDDRIYCIDLVDGDQEYYHC